MLRREFLFSINNPCDRIRMIKLAKVNIQKADIAIFNKVEEITVTANSPEFVYVLLCELSKIKVWRFERLKREESEEKNAREIGSLLRTIHSRRRAVRRLPSWTPMIYEEQFGDDGGRCVAVAAPVYRRYPISATADGSRIYRPIGCHRYCNSLLIVRRLFDHWRDL